MGKQHGSIQYAGRVRNKTPKVAKKEKNRKVTHRAMKRLKFRKNFKNGERIVKRKR